MSTWMSTVTPVHLHFLFSTPFPLHHREFWLLRNRLRRTGKCIGQLWTSHEFGLAVASLTSPEPGLTITPGKHSVQVLKRAEALISGHFGC